MVGRAQNRFGVADARGAAPDDALPAGKLQMGAERAHQGGPTIEHDERAIAVGIESHFVGERRAFGLALEASQ